MLTDWDKSPAFAIEEFWKKALRPLEEHPRVRDVRIHGSIAAVEIEAEGGYLADIGAHMRRSCLAKDVLLRPLGNVLYALPPLETSRISLKRIAEAIVGCVSAPFSP